MPTALSTSDPARAVIATILALAPATHWSFARFEGHGQCDQLLSSTDDPLDFDRLKLQFSVQRAGSIGPHIGATPGELKPCRSGLTLLFADSRAQFGMLTLLRNAELGPFSSSELRILGFALEAASESFSTLRLLETHEASGETLEPAIARDSVLYILDRELAIVLAPCADDAHLHDRLPRLLEDAIRMLTASWTGDVATHSAGTAYPTAFLQVRTYPLCGAAGTFVGVAIERTTSPDSLTHAADHFGISPREVQVLALLLRGAHLNDVANRLFITASTVQDHIKSLLYKTATRNRSEMIATVLRTR